MRKLIVLIILMLIPTVATFSQSSVEEGIVLLPSDPTSKAIIRSMDISNDGKYVVAAAFDNNGQNTTITTLMWILNEESSNAELTPAFAKTDVIPFTFVANVAFSPNNQYFITHADNSLLVYETTELHLFKVFRFRDISIRVVVWSEDSQFVSVLYHDPLTDKQKFTVWDIVNGNNHSLLFSDFSPSFVGTLGEQWLFYDVMGNLEWCDLILDQCNEQLPYRISGSLVVGSNFVLQSIDREDGSMDIGIIEDLTEIDNMIYPYNIDNDEVDVVSNNRQYIVTFNQLWELTSGNFLARVSSNCFFTSDSRLLVGFNSRDLSGYNTSDGSEAFSIDVSKYVNRNISSYFIEDKSLHNLSSDDTFAVLSIYNFAVVIPIPKR